MNDEFVYRPPMPGALAILRTIADVKEAGLSWGAEEDQAAIRKIMLRHAPAHEWNNAVVWERREEF